MLSAQHKTKSWRCWGSDSCPNLNKGSRHRLTMIGRRAILMGLVATPFYASASAFSLSDLLSRIQDDLPELKLIDVARQQIGVTRYYDPAYVSLDYPGGDFDRASGVCTDVIIRAYRDAFDFDLQKAMHEDMAANFSEYPKIWGLSRPDKNIDHRRVPNIERFLKRGRHELPTDEWNPGDLITCRVGNLPHIGIVSYPLTRSGVPKVIHNIGRGTREENVIGLYNNERRFRFLPSI